jgi:hypothetical protein
VTDRLPVALIDLADSMVCGLPAASATEPIAAPICPIISIGCFQQTLGNRGFRARSRCSRARKTTLGMTGPKVQVTQFNVAHAATKS